MKKRKKKSPVQKLHDKASALWKEYCYLRDGKRCMVRKHFPGIKIAHTDVYQVDHCITRANKLLFYNTSNGTVVCNSCNRAKGFKNKSIGRAIDEIVKLREGEEAFDDMVAIDRKMSQNHNWNKVWYLEEIIIGLESQVEFIKHRKELE